VEHVAAELERTGVEGRRLVFDIKEGEALDNIEGAIEFARALAAIGCKVAIDDFGSGFAGFSFIKRLPFEFLKIDGGFIRDLLDNPNDRLIVEALVHVAGGMGKRTIAEFVADEATLREVSKLGVDCAQGFHVGAPAPVTDLPPKGESEGAAQPL